MPPFLLPLITWGALLLRYPRRTLAVALPLVLLLLTLAGWVQWQEHSNRKLLARLEISLQYSPQDCPAERPLLVQLHNGSPRALLALQWQIAAYRPGERTNLTQQGYNSPVYDSRQPLSPAAQWQHCLPLPELRPGYRASTLEFAAERLRGQFD